MTLQSRGKIVSFIRFRKTQKIFNRNSCGGTDVDSGVRGVKPPRVKPRPRPSHLQLLLAVEVVEEMMKVDLRHLSEQREKTGHVLPLDERTRQTRTHVHKGL